MNRRDLDIHRQHYGGTMLGEILEKLAAALEHAGVADADLAALSLAEWIRRTWGGGVVIERHNGEPRDHSRLDDLRAYALAAGLSDRQAAKVLWVIQADFMGKYVPRIPKLNQLARDTAIWQQGSTPAALERLARQHNMSVIRAYQINRDVQQQRDRYEQPALPGVAG